MIEKETVLILGAGASIVYGYPSGNELVNQICTNLKTPYTDRDFTQQIHTFIDLDFRPKDTITFRNALANCAKDTIDEFLTTNPSFDKIGKHAIAMEIIRCEHQLKLTESGNTSNNWYKYLFTAMTNGQNKIDTFPNNKISFITFNYDRSLEQFFYTALKNNYHGTPDEIIFDILKKIPIIHVHGQVGKMPWQGENFRHYQPSVDCDNIKKGASGIITINEADEELPEFIKARKLILNAKEVIFLGFGFDSTNIKHLNATGCFQQKKVIGTARGFSDKRMRRLFEDFRREVKVSSLTDIDIDSFMKHHTDWM